MCKLLESVTLPNKLEKICSATFAQCEALKSIDIPDSVRIIDTEAFKWCKSLSIITLPNKLEEIGLEAFSWCGIQTKDIVIPSSVKKIGEGIFTGTGISCKVIFKDTSGWQKRLVDDVYFKPRSDWEDIDSSVLADSDKTKSLLKYNSDIYWEDGKKLINYYEFQKV